MDISKSCCTCLKENEMNMMSVFDTVRQQKHTNANFNDAELLISDNLTIACMISACTSTKIIDIKISPKQVCLECFESLYAAYLFRRRCEKAFQRLKTLLNEYIKGENSMATNQSISSGTTEKIIQTVDSCIVPCEFCKLKFFDAQELKAHRALHRETAIKCRLCAKEYTRFADLRRHIASAHCEEFNVKPKHICGICNKIFSRADRLGRHIRCVHKQTQKIIEVDVDLDMNDDLVVKNDDYEDENGGSKQNVIGNKQSDVLQIDENIQAERDSDNEKLRLNNDEYNPGTTEDNSSDSDFKVEKKLKVKRSTTEQKKTYKKYACEKCPEIFDTFLEYRQHKNEHKSEQTQFICDICQKSFQAARYLKRHLLIHKRQPLECRICQGQFQTRNELNQHTKDHPSEKTHLCSECGSRFARNSELTRHMRQHSGEKPFKCKYCGRSFTRSHEAVRHEKCHTGEKSHLCTICGLKFIKSYNLSVHMRTHTKEKPYQCPHCDKRFARGDDLKLHIRRHSGQRYTCEICGSAFIQNYLLSRHLRTVHSIDVGARCIPIELLSPVSPSKSSSH